jgi:hypothetical protein
MLAMFNTYLVSSVNSDELSQKGLQGKGWWVPRLCVHVPLIYHVRDNTVPTEIHLTALRKETLVRVFLLGGYV